jgi:hypothetical protein
MRFAWQREQTANTVSINPGMANRLVFITYNVVWWLPMVLTLIGAIDSPTGFVAFFVITLIRAGANLYRNNALTLEQAEGFPLRAP